MMRQLPTAGDLTKIFSLTDEQAGVLEKLNLGLPYAADDFDDALIYLNEDSMLPCNNRMARILYLIDADKCPAERIALSADLSDLDAAAGLREPTLQ